jgi:hypothetical protein
LHYRRGCIIGEIGRTFGIPSSWSPVRFHSGNARHGRDKRRRERKEKERKRKRDDASSTFRRKTHPVPRSIASISKPTANNTIAGFVRVMIYHKICVFQRSLGRIFENAFCD